MTNNTTKQKPCGYWNNYENNYNEALKYNSRSEFKKGSSGAYRVACKNGWLDNYNWFEEKCKPNGYWETYENNYNEAQKYNSRNEFQKGCSSAYKVACKNGWLDNYNWFEEKCKPNGYWIYETCYQEAKKYNSRSEFQKGCISAYDVARQNGWLDNYNWFSDSKTIKKWNEKTCYQEAKKYKSRREFQRGCGRAYQVARQNDWLDNYTWFTEKKKHNYWNYETCYNEAQKYNSRSEFNKGCRGAYKVACQNDWLDNYNWFAEKPKYGYWTYETCLAEAQKYKSRSEFKKGCSSAYNVARKNGWLDNYTWFEKDLNPYTNNLDNVYCYLFEELKSVYVGRTININKRNKEHNIQTNSAVYKFAQQYNIVIPQITILESNLSLEQGREKEHFYVTKYKSEGWNVLNIAKTGKNCGSLGGLGSGKWNEKTCYQEAKKYKSRTEFQKGCSWAYQVARQNDWLDNYTWFTEKYKPHRYWNKQTCYQEAKKYKSRNEFQKGCSSAYQVARQNDWLDNYTWFTEKQKQKHNGYWETYENNYNEAQKYNSRNEFYKGCNSAYNVARKNGWLDIFFPKGN